MFNSFGEGVNSVLAILGLAALNYAFYLVNMKLKPWSVVVRRKALLDQELMAKLTVKKPDLERADVSPVEGKEAVFQGTVDK